MWKEHYRIGSDLVDSQHKELFDRVGSCIKAGQDEGAREERLEQVQATLEFMKEYVVIHFRDEEALQAEIGYPGLEKHAAIHAAFREEIRAVAQRVEQEGFDEEKVQEFASRVMTWLLMHVGKEYQKIGVVIRSQGGQS